MKKKQRKDAQETQQRLLRSAARVFAEQGFWGATHADICRRAKANIAAVNYYFGTKENLYVEAWKHAFDMSVQAHPVDGGVSPDAPAEERLRGQILAFVHRMADPDNCEVEIMHKEMANSTGLLNEAVRRVMEPMRESTFSIVRKLLGDGATEQDVHLCGMSIMGQCFGPMLHMRRARSKPAGARLEGPPIPFTVEEMAGHIVRFSLAGIRGIREEIQRRNPSGPRRSRRVSKQGQS